MMNRLDKLNALKDLPDWTYNIERKCLQREFTFKSYLKTIGFVNAVAWLATKHNHHPDMVVSFNKCLIELTTHDEGDVSEKDLKLAYDIDHL